MAPPARKISKQEWKRHDATIHNLYHVRGLPLHSEKGGPSVQQIMRDQHQFSASLSQYEAYFRKRDQPKNLKKEEWRAVHDKLSELSAMNIEARVKVSGHVLSRKRIERSRRHAFPLPQQPRQHPSNGFALPPPHRVTIETRGANGEWSAYTGGNTIADTHPHPPAVDHAVLESEESSTLVPISQYKAPFMSSFAVSPQHVRGNQALFLSSQESLLFGSPPSPWNDSFLLADFGHSIEMGDSWSFPPSASQLSRPSPVALPSPSAYATPFTSQYWDRESPFFQLQKAVSAKPRLNIHSQRKPPKYTGAGHEYDSVSSIEPQTSPKLLVQSLLEESAQILISNSTSCNVFELPDPDDVLDSLLSLLPESPAQDVSGQTAGLAIRDAIFDSPFHSALLFSIANSFAGLRNIPSGAILRVLRKQPQISSQLFDCLRSCPPALSKPFAGDLFRAAVEACDEQAVIVILQITRNMPNAINPNEIVCRLEGEGRLYTPIEHAAKFRHLSLVQTLLAANADVNKTYEQDENQERGALELAVRKWGKYEAVDMKLVRTLLDCHAEVRVDLVSAVIRWGQADLLRELISRLPPASHHRCFETDFMLKSTSKYLGNNLATQIIKQIFEYCQAENCMRCPAKHQELMEITLGFAARRGNLELVEFLLPHTAEKCSALSAAVRNGSRELIDLLLQHGASVVGSTRCLDIDYPFFDSNGKDSPNFYPRTTPLAEAIRSQNKDLIQEFEILGALSHIDQEIYFEATIFAAAEVGNCHYIQKLLERVPEKRGKCLTPALTVAIRNDETEAALILLNDGADVNAKTGWPGPGPPLIEALGRQNRTIVEGILEADVDVNPHYNIKASQTSVMETAGLWGDIPIIENLIFMGADIDAGLQTTALAAAVKSRNRALVELLLKRGASPSEHAESGVSPLDVAIANEDDDMTRLLLSSGADPANANAFLSAIENNQRAFNTLLETFSAKYPQGKIYFGGSLLIKAIEKGDATLLNTMLTAKFDVNSFSIHDHTLLTVLGFAIIYRKGRDPELVQKLIDAGGDPNSIVRKPYDIRRDQHHSIQCGKVGPQESALTVAIKTRNEKMVELLLMNGADVHRPARNGLKRTPLQQACEIGSFKMVKLLLERQASVNERPADRGGATALQLAAISGSIKIAKLLLTYGALVHAPPAKVNGRSAFEGAAEHGCLEMIKVLWDAVSGLGFTPEQIENAITLAKSRGHRGCADYIASLSLADSFLLL
ncbi:ankyrin [Acephala macrosclerotiorum]|nr:ankyrin [Acephala macrosclerotiorum]